MSVRTTLTALAVGGAVALGAGGARAATLV
jgi:hypothetical protein